MIPAVDPLKTPAWHVAGVSDPPPGTLTTDCPDCPAGTVRLAGRWYPYKGVQCIGHAIIGTAATIAVLDAAAPVNGRHRAPKTAAVAPASPPVARVPFARVGAAIVALAKTLTRLEARRSAWWALPEHRASSWVKASCIAFEGFDAGYLGDATVETFLAEVDYPASRLVAFARQARVAFAAGTSWRYSDDRDAAMPALAVS